MSDQLMSAAVAYEPTVFVIAMCVCAVVIAFAYTFWPYVERQVQIKVTKLPDTPERRWIEIRTARSQ